MFFSLRYFRSEDRSIHERSYPELHYPEIYLLEGGYKTFYEYSKVGIVYFIRKIILSFFLSGILYSGSISNND